MPEYSDYELYIALSVVMFLFSAVSGYLYPCQFERKKWEKR
ncbi:hypothetical protein Cst_c01900 [Thermoclostridium stercorarium subsp. stercorarium DSM 8532]|uniref:Uncharacterized protein n=1 Tax=Thermoclostridium stercorarium (strain ATCC 35414 / DSM 8532 / NCIMB 11754) TaxID=1121335 RepID=L7VGW7_THES1|nr:hypothetical protein Cst_c01900 [Thermoclostridium stercorarium subsp. stercorarium DSM 8532]